MAKFVLNSIMFICTLISWIPNSDTSPLLNGELTTLLPNKTVQNDTLYNATTYTGTNGYSGYNYTLSITKNEQSSAVRNDDEVNNTLIDNTTAYLDTASTSSIDSTVFFNYTPQLKHKDNSTIWNASDDISASEITTEYLLERIKSNSITTPSGERNCN